MIVAGHRHLVAQPARVQHTEDRVQCAGLEAKRLGERVEPNTLLFRLMGRVDDQSGEVVVMIIVFLKAVSTIIVIYL